MASVHIITRSVKDKDRPKRHIVRFRRGGRYHRLEHGGSFKTLREANERRNLIAGWLALGLAGGGRGGVGLEPRRHR